MCCRVLVSTAPDLLTVSEATIPDLLTISEAPRSLGTLFTDLFLFDFKTPA